MKTAQNPNGKQLLGFLSHHSEAVIHTFAEQEHLPQPDPAASQLAVIATALQAGKVPAKHLERFLDRETAALLARLPGDAMARFAETEGLDPTGNGSELPALLDRALARGRIALDRLEAFVADEQVRALGETADAAIRGFAARQRIRLPSRPGVGDRAAQLQAIRRALGEGSVSLEDLDAYIAEIPQVMQGMARLGELKKEAILGFALRHGLPGEDDVEAQLAAIAEALFAGSLACATCARFEKRVTPIDEAVAELQKFRRKEPATDGACDVLDIRKTGGLAEKRAAIRLALYRGSATLQDLVAYLDRLAEHGRQHVFFYHINKKVHTGYLALLAQSRFVRRRLRESGHQDCLTEPRFVWKPERLELAATELRPGPSLLLKWVETRCVRGLDERKVSFFHLHLRTGQAELRIQKIEKNAKKVLRESHERLERQLRKIFDFERFGPVLLEPAIRRLLVSNRFRVDRFRLELANGGSLAGHRGGRSFVNTLKLAFKKFFAVEVKGDWVVDARKYPVRVNGRSDELYQFWEWDPRPNARFLRWLHAGGEPLPPDPASHLALIRRKGLSSLKQIGRRRIKLEDLKKSVTQETPYTFNQLVTALESGGDPELVGMYYSVRCPKSRWSVGDQDGPKRFERLQQVGKSIRCHNHPGGVETHPTASAIWVTFPELKLPIPWQIFSAYLLLGAAFIFATGATGFLLSQVDSNSMRLTTGASYVLTLVVLIALMKQLIGRDELEDAKNELMSFRELIRAWFKSPNGPDRGWLRGWWKPAARDAVKSKKGQAKSPKRRHS